MSVESSPDDVFINCPFDPEYAELFRALVFAIYACGFRPRSARELDDSGFARLDKILSIIEECRYGVHDLSRTELNPVFNLPRFNMPFELGLFLAARRFGDDSQKKKRTLVLDTEPYRYQKFLSDLNGMDIVAHARRPTQAVRALRNWLANVSRRRLAADSLIVASFERFRDALPLICDARGYSLAALPYIDFEFIVTDWLLHANPET